MLPRAYGAELIEHGKDFDEVRLRAEEWVESEGLTHVHNANEPDLINGVGTCALEIYEEFPGLDVIVVLLGGGYVTLMSDYAPSTTGGRPNPSSLDKLFDSVLKDSYFVKRPEL